MDKKIKNKYKSKNKNKKIFKVITIIVIVLFGILVYNSKALFAQFLFYTTMPYQDSSLNISMLFDLGRYDNEKTEVESQDFILVGRNEFDENTSEEEIISTFNPDKIEEGIIFDREIGLIGLNDLNNIIYQPDDHQFGPAVNIPFEFDFNYNEIEELRDVNILINRFYSMDSNVGIIDSKFDIDYFLNADLFVEKNENEPQILIFHTHAASEFFIDSDTSNLYEGVVGAGAELTRILEEKYGLNVIHYTGVYDKVDGRINRTGAYERIEPSINAILEENPSIEVVIDLHRDGVREGSNPDFTRYINGKPTAKLMFVNGVSAINENGNIRNLYNLKNPYINENLALSFRMQMAADEHFQGITRRLYLKAFRYMNHLRPRSMLVEVGSQYTTKEEAWNSMEVLADLIYKVIFTN